MKNCLDSIIFDLISYKLLNDFEIIIVDGKSTDKTKNLIDEYNKRYDNIKYIMQENIGLPNARNVGLALSFKDFVVFFDDDVVVKSGYFEELIKIFKDNKIGGVCGSYQQQETSFTPKIQSIKNALDKLMIGGWLGFDAPIGKVFSNGFSTSNFEYAKNKLNIDRLTGCNMAYSKRAILKNGNFDENYGGNAAGEDTDYSYRLKKINYDLIVDPELKILHFNVEDQKFPYSDKTIYFSIKNQIYFFFKNVFDPKKFNLFYFVLGIYYNFILYLFASLFFNRLSIFTSYYKGVIDGFNYVSKKLHF